jgi:pSer/pThr/pTyr-binding forkhead associated (FHA) protein
MYLLEVLSGPLDGKTWTFEREITIGRDDAVADACIALDRYVSRKHARVRVGEDASIVLEDLQSRNGTKLAGQPVVGHAPLPVGVPFTVGRTVLRVTQA